MFRSIRGRIMPEFDQNGMERHIFDEIKAYSERISY